MYKKTLILVLIILAVLVAFLYPPTQVNSEHTQDEHPTVESPVTTPPVVEKIEVIVEGKPFDSLVLKYSQKHGVDYYLMDAIMDCENRDRLPALQSFHRYNEGQIRRNPTWGVVGEREKSYGLVQIHLPSNPHVTYEQAIDPDFAIEFLAQGIADGYASRWSCYKMI